MSKNAPHKQKLSSPTSRRRFGRIFVTDRRDNKFALKAKKSSRTFRYWSDQSPVLDQEETPSCVGQGWAHWLSSYPVRQFINGFGLYDLCKYKDEYDGEDYEGTSVRAGAKVLQALGFISEYQWAKNIDAVVYALLEEGPVVIGVNWYESMFNPDKNGLIKVSGEAVGGHCVMLHGINIQSGLLTGKNSWGAAWGNKGHFTISLSDMKRLLSENGEVCLAKERTPE